MVSEEYRARIASVKAVVLDVVQPDILRDRPAAGMNKGFCPLLEKFCPLFNHFAQLDSKLPRW